ncbi:glycosyltransferase [Paraglaciecola sp.]|uniref:glycosyltransferase n=1 Tax=Paraglaciecola sp. TaxID=1920173 RepID=UPI003EFB3AD4
MPLPLVSVVMPVFNDYTRLDKCLQAISQQSYKGEIEVIVADNNSTQFDDAIIEKHSNVTKIIETKPGSYAARNKAIPLLNGKIIAFTDSDCIPDLDWIENGVTLLQNKQYSLIAGNVEIFFEGPSRKPNWVEIFESILAFPQKENAALGRSVTANLMITADALSAVGQFEEDTYSGADYQFTRRATSQGFKITFGDNVTVKHPARDSIGQIRKKARRVVGGFYELRKVDSNMASQFSAKSLIEDALPPFHAIRSCLDRKKSHDITWSNIIKAVCIAWHNKIYRLYLKLSLVLGIGIKTER